MRALSALQATPVRARLNIPQTAENSRSRDFLTVPATFENTRAALARPSNRKEPTVPSLKGVLYTALIALAVIYLDQKVGITSKLP